MHNGLFKHKRRCVIALGRLGAVLVAFANCFGRHPRHIGCLGQQRFDVGDGGGLLSIAGFQCIEHHAGEQPQPHLLARRRLVEHVDRDDLFANGDSRTGGALGILQPLLEFRDPALVRLEGSLGTRGCCVRSADGSWFCSSEITSAGGPWKGRSPHSNS